MSDLFGRVNQFGVLRAPLWLWLIVAFQARHWLVFVGTGASVRRSPDAAQVLGGEGVPYLQLALEVPVLLLVYAALNRDPSGGAPVRWLWRRGREIVTPTAALNVAWIAWYFAGIAHWKAMPDNVILLTALVDLLIVAAMWTNEYLKELFADFPQPRPPEPKA